MPVSLNTERKGVSILWDEVDPDQEVTVVASREGDPLEHNKRPQPNDGEAGLFFPAGYSGELHVEVRDADGNVVSEGDIAV